MTGTLEAMRRLFSVGGTVTNLPAYPEIYPNREGPIIRAGQTGERYVDRALWGVPPPIAGARPVTNVRNLASSFWRSALTNPANRCLVPVTAFAEWTAEPDPTTGRKRKVWFEVIDAEMFVFAGIIRPTAEGEADRYAFLTCAPNSCRRDPPQGDARNPTRRSGRRLVDRGPCGGARLAYGRRTDEGGFIDL